MADETNAGLNKLGTVFTDTPGSLAPNNDLDYFKKKVNPEYQDVGNGWREPLKDTTEDDFIDRVQALMKVNPVLANQILRRALDMELNQSLQKRSSHPYSM